MLRTIITLLFIATTFSSIGQIKTASMLGDRKYYKDGRRLRMYQLTELLKENPEATKLYSKAKGHYTLAQVAGIPGGLLIGWQLGRMLTGNKPNATGLAVGLALEAIYIPLQHSYNVKSRKAVNLYNDEQVSFVPQKRMKWFVLANQNGIGIGANF